jgi:STE24 endopeptidase
MQSNQFSIVFAVALLAQLAFHFWLMSRQTRHVSRHRDALPPGFEHQFTLAEHQKAADYTLAKLRFGGISTAISTAILLGWTLLGGLNALNVALLKIPFIQSTSPIIYQLALLGSFALIQGIIGLPLAAWSTFRVEQAHGFNRTTPALFWADVVKGMLVGLVIGLPISALILWVMQSTGAYWWLLAWAIWMGFNLLMLVLFPTVIAPIFNRFTPLEDTPLRQRAEALMQRCGFRSKGFFVMDGSRRSAHANAYFTGFGAAKRVVFFDTLLKRLSGEEVEAVLAHELGHFKHKHVLKNIIGMFALSFFGFALLGWLGRQTWFFEGLGVQPQLQMPNDAMALLLFMLVIPVFSTFFSPLMAALSRRHEFQADAYACEQTQGQDLINALIKLYQDNASTLTPDPIYVRVYYSHPPAIERIAAMQRLITPGARA